MYKDDLSIDYLNVLFSYDENTGIVKRKTNNRNAKIGDIVGTKNDKGYLLTKINNRAYRLHRIIWALKTGEWPIRMIDHKDGDKANNKWNNLREANDIQNQQNRGAPVNNKTGVKGVSFIVSKMKYRASITLKKKYISLGYFDSVAAAAEIRKNAEIKYFGEFAK